MRYPILFALIIAAAIAAPYADVVVNTLTNAANIIGSVTP